MGSGNVVNAGFRILRRQTNDRSKFNVPLGVESQAFCILRGG